MKVLIAPMAAMAETSGPFSRARSLCLALEQRGHLAALCAAKDVNYRPIDGILNYEAPLPSPLGLPLFLGKRMFKIAQLTGAQQRQTVHSFEQVLHFVGAGKAVDILENVIRSR